MNTLNKIIEKVVTSVGWLLLFAVLGFYVYGVTEAIRQTILANSQRPVVYPEFLSTTVGSIQALLLTNLGILLGISVTAPQSGIAQSMRLTSDSSEGGPTPALDFQNKVQLFALLVFVFSLIACTVTWIAKGFDTDTTHQVPLIVECAKMFIGVSLAYLTLMLRTRPGQTLNFNKNDMATRSTVTKKVKQFIGELTNRDPGTIRVGDSLSDFGFDDNGIRLLLEQINPEWGILILPSEAANCETVNDLVSLVMEKLP
ncbi:MAG TPA: hypothetical protein VGD65_06190 [Chryseosolibacter sp.]